MKGPTMFWRTTTFLALMLLSAQGLSAAPPAADERKEQPVSCPKVIAASDRLEHERPSKSRDPIYIGRKLKTHPFWVERCLLAYGRRVSRRVRVDAQTRDKLEKQWESGPVEKVGPQEMESDSPARGPRHGKGRSNAGSSTD
jgi:hypothetical protein